MSLNDQETPRQNELTVERVVSQLEHFLTRKTAELVPDSFRKLTIKALNPHTSILNDPLTQEGAHFIHDSESIIIRLRVQKKKKGAPGESTLLFSRDKRSEWQIDLSEVVRDITLNHDQRPDYLNMLLAQSVHEAIHGLTLHTLWKNDIKVHNKLLNIALENIKKTTTQDILNQWFHEAWLTMPIFEHPEKAYKDAVERKRKMTKIILANLPEEHQKEYLKIAYYRGISEIIAYMISAKVRPFYSSTVAGYTGYFYSVRAAYMIYPSQEQHKLIVDAVQPINLPLTPDSIEIMRSLGNARWFVDYTTSNDYTQLF